VFIPSLAGWLAGQIARRCVAKVVLGCRAALKSGALLGACQGLACPHALALALDGRQTKGPEHGLASTRSFPPTALNPEGDRLEPPWGDKLIVTGDAAPIRSGTGAPQQPCRLRADRSGLCGGLLVERVFGIKALQRMIDMHGCQQIPGLREPFFDLGQ
jgi:hypothetical protein